jgi:FHA domain
MRIVLHGSTGDIAVPMGAHILGRGNDCTLRIDDPRLSRHHAELHHHGDYVTITDKGSTNGVLINGERVRGPQRLESGQTIICGPCVFTITMDPTQKASKSELIPQTDRHNEGHDTEAMDPLELPKSDAIPASSKNRQISPLIAAALSPASSVQNSPTPDNSTPDEPTPDNKKQNKAPKNAQASSIALAPSHDEKTGTGALATKNGGNEHIPGKPTSNKFISANDANKPKRDQTSALFPSEFTENNSGALQPDFPFADRLVRAKPLKRTLGGLFDGLTCALLIISLSLPCFIGGYAWSLIQAGAVMDGPLPRLSSTPSESLSALMLAQSLIAPGGIERAITLMETMARMDDQQPFLTFFVTSTLGCLVVAVVFLLYLVGGTVLHGAPYWQRKMGLCLVENHTGYRLTWIRAVIRWLLWICLWPLVVITMFITRRSAHDVLSGCDVRQQS